MVSGMSYAPVGTSAATVDGEVIEVENVEMLMSPHKPWSPETPRWQPTPQWSSGMFECLMDCGVCLVGCCCPCILVGQMWERVMGVPGSCAKITGGLTCGYSLMFLLLTLSVSGCALCAVLGRLLQFGCFAGMLVGVMLVRAKVCGRLSCFTMHHRDSV